MEKTETERNHTERNGKKSGQNTETEFSREKIFFNLHSCLTKIRNIKTNRPKGNIPFV